jgi:hypothetical protein
VSSCSPGLTGPGACPNINVYGGSPVLGAGTTWSGETVDYFGNPFPATPNIGASQQLPVPQTNVSFDAATCSVTGSLPLEWKWRDRMELEARIDALADTVQLLEAALAE